MGFSGAMILQRFLKIHDCSDQCQCKRIKTVCDNHRKVEYEQFLRDVDLGRAFVLCADYIHKDLQDEGNLEGVTFLWRMVNYSNE
jgi:hypothetical protein